MNKDIHPKIYAEAKVSCVCGNTFITISTVPLIQVDICSSCHPLFTGQQKFVDTEGRIDKFQKKAKQIAEKKQKQDEVNKTKKAKVETAKETKPQSLKDIFKQLKEEEKQESNKSEATE